MEQCKKQTLHCLLLLFNQENIILTERLPMICWFQALCDALQYIHKCGYIHRDVKPSNIMISQNGELKLGDFGLARDTGYQTQTGSIGTKLYVSPVQLYGTKYNESTDVYPLG